MAITIDTENKYSIFTTCDTVVMDDCTLTTGTDYITTDYNSCAALNLLTDTTGLTYTNTNTMTVGDSTYNNVMTYGTGSTVTNTRYDNSIIYAASGTRFENVTFNNSKIVVTPPSEQELKKIKFRAELDARRTVYIKTRANIIKDVPENEITAIETLREEITESEFRKYMKFGFINVMGGSGRIYQIFRNRTHIKVWEHGQIVEEICVYLPDSSVPPTDKVIAFKTMIETDETEFKTFGNVYKMRKAA